MVDVLLRRWINRMALSPLGSANLVRSGLRPCIHRKSQQSTIHFDTRDRGFEV